jgi:hypothetical protein
MTGASSSGLLCFAIEILAVSQSQAQTMAQTQYQGYAAIPITKNELTSACAGS